MNKFRGLWGEPRPFVVSIIGLILSALVSYFVTIGTIRLNAAVQEKRIEIIEEKQRHQDQKTDKIFESLSQIGADVRVTRSETRAIHQRLDRLEQRLDVAQGVIK
jgi:polyhydroxyalkanoate synthesis regulator phasin